MILRDYQVECSDSIFDSWKDAQSTLAVLFTGAGKTIILANVIKRFQPLRALVLAHREELIFQARERIETSTGIGCEIEMADMQALTNLFHKSPVVISTIQTQNSGNGTKRFERFDPNEFGLLIVDEAHHAVSPSYRKVLEHYKKNPDLRILGVTATPDRADETALGQVFETVAFDYEILDGINNGWLVPIHQQIVKVSGLDFSDIRTVAGDLNLGQLSALMEQEKNMQGVAGASIDIIGDKRALAFTASVHQAEQLSEIFNRHKMGSSKWVCGETPKDERRKMLKEFSDGTVQIMVNCNCLSEGYDNPAVEVIIQARPTKSRCLYAQQVGRATRALPGVVDGLEDPEQRKSAIASSKKPSCLVVDFVGNSGQHKLMTSADILGGKMSEEIIDRAVEKAKKSGVCVPMSELLEETQKEMRLEAERRRKDEESRRAKLKAKVAYTTKIVNPFDLFDIDPVQERGWDTVHPASQKQIDLLLKFKIDANGWSKPKASKMIGECFTRREKGLCTYGQGKTLTRYGYEVKNMTYKDAHETLNKLAANGWKPLPPSTGPAST